MMNNIIQVLNSINQTFFQITGLRRTSLQNNVLIVNIHKHTLEPSKIKCSISENASDTYTVFYIRRKILPLTDCWRKVDTAVVRARRFWHKFDGPWILLYILLKRQKSNIIGDLTHEYGDPVAKLENWLANRVIAQ